jgi:hypothetical protein
MLNLISSRHGPRTEKTSVLLRDVTAYAEMFLLSCCLLTGCITQFILLHACYYLAMAVSVAQQFLHWQALHNMYLEDRLHDACYNKHLYEFHIDYTELAAYS